MRDKKSIISIGKFFSIALTVSVPITVGFMIVVDNHIENHISNIEQSMLKIINGIDSVGVVMGPDKDTVTVDALMAAPSTLFIYAPPNTLFVPSPPGTTIVIHRETQTVFDTVRVEKEKPKPLWWDDPRRVGRIWSL